MAPIPTASPEPSKPHPSLEWKLEHSPDATAGIILSGMIVLLLLKSPIPWIIFVFVWNVLKLVCQRIFTRFRSLFTRRGHSRAQRPMIRHLGLVEGDEPILGLPPSYSPQAPQHAWLRTHVPEQGSLMRAPTHFSQDSQNSRHGHNEILPSYEMAMMEAPAPAYTPRRHSFPRAESLRRYPREEGMWMRVLSGMVAAAAGGAWIRSSFIEC